MATGIPIPGSRGEHRGLSYWMERSIKELEKVRTSPDPDAVHDLRVAIRRCRSVAAVMEEVDPDSSWPKMRKLGRKLFRQLGELRDTQVLEEWVEKLGDEDDPIRAALSTRLKSREAELREAAVAAAGKFDEKAWRKLEQGLERRSRMVPPDGLAAECLALERLEAAKELHSHALRAEKPRAWHELRIGIKRFRYTVEALLPAKYEVWGDDLKHVQDLLGEVHDLDVLADTIAEVAVDATEEARARWSGRIAAERQQRIDTYRQLATGKESLWLAWRQGLPDGRRLEGSSMARLRVTARALDEHPARTSLISRIAMHLFDGLARTQASPAFQSRDTRKIMRAAARLHGIGSALDAHAPSQAARDFLREMALPAGWTKTEWEIAAQAVRYQRGPIPQNKHKSFSRLDGADQKTVCALAGVLRLARTLRKCGLETAVGLRIEKSADAFVVHVPGLAVSEAAASRLATGKYLLETFLEKPLILRAEPPVPKLVELPKPQNEPPQSAVASD
ncbi:MAG TPA: CHAD domain-containing protein [Candidatus Saccharimonadales bacterium]|nr:CHAD domain-containing protein [Candidatus Saccharimonadales bacterium]